MITGRKAFTGDWSVREFEHRGNSFSVPTLSFNDVISDTLHHLIHGTLKIDWNQRFGADAVRVILIYDILERGLLQCATMPQLPMCDGCTLDPQIEVVLMRTHGLIVDRIMPSTTYALPRLCSNVEEERDIQNTSIVNPNAQNNNTRCGDMEKETKAGL